MYNAERNREIVAMRDSGMPFSQIWVKFNLSPARAREIYKKEKQRIEEENTHVAAVNGDIPYTFYDALLEVCETKTQAVRIFRCLLRSGIYNEMAANNGSLDSYSDDTLLGISNFGTISLIFARRANKLYKEKTRNIH